MNNYDFGRLSPLRFEQLSRDLLSSRYGPFENFAEGKDGGIDFRYSQSNDNVLLVQCKRYKNFQSLLTSLKKEVNKIEQLYFSTYLLVVSLDLTPPNKEKILQLYNGKIKNTEHIITNTDLNHLLGLPDNHHIEFKFPELWMNSVNVHQHIFNLGLLDHSSFLKDKIQESLKNFVPYKEYYQLLEHYKSNNVAIIAGLPGIGKTTLSHAVLSNYIYYQKYQIIDLSYRKIQEAESFLAVPNPTFFLIDDFLGQIKLDKGNDYTQLLYYFIQKIERSENKKLVLTSREYILKRASREYSTVSRIDNLIMKYVIELNSFTRRVRTEILYNHVKNSALIPSFLDDFLQNDVIRIIDHMNYNPRIVEHLTNPGLLKGIRAENYFDFFIKNLQTPNAIWKMVYNNFPNDLYKLLLLVKFLVNEKLPIERLEKSIMAYVKNTDKFRSFSFDDFEHVINELEGTFFTFQTEKDELVDKKYTIVEFQNPSIKDFIDSFIWTKKEWLYLIIEHAIYYEQIFNWELLELIMSDEALRKIFRKRVIEDFDKLENAGIGYFRYESLNGAVSSCWVPGRHHYYLNEASNVLDLKKDTEFTDFLIKESFKYTFDDIDDFSEKISFSEVAANLIKLGLIDGFRAIKHYSEGIIYDLEDLEALANMLEVSNEKSLRLIRRMTHLVRNVDKIIQVNIKHADKLDYFGLEALMEHYDRVKDYLPLAQTARILKKQSFDDMFKNAKIDDAEFIDDNNQFGNDEKDKKYNDINDVEIKRVFDNIRDTTNSNND